MYSYNFQSFEPENYWGAAECKFWKAAVPKGKIFTLFNKSSKTLLLIEANYSRKMVFNQVQIKVTSKTKITLTILYDIREITKELAGDKNKFIE